jgi:putative tricarboxylic transport membrane protein
MIIAMLKSLRHIIDSRRIDWAHVITLGGLMTWVTWYWLDTRSVSVSLLNLMLVQPASVAALVLSILILPQCFPRRSQASQQQITDHLALARTGSLMLVSVLFVILMFTTGVDLAILLFTASCLIIGGERRWLVVMGFSLITTVSLIKGYQWLIPYDISLIFLDMNAHD